jgi:hypothetical protein
MNPPIAALAGRFGLFAFACTRDQLLVAASVSEVRLLFGYQSIADDSTDYRVEELLGVYLDC